MLIVALILAVIGLAALVTAVVTSNELIAWVCIGASGLGVLLLIVDAIRDRSRRRAVSSATGAAVTEVIEPVETTEVIEPVVDTPDVVDDGDVVDDEIASDTEDFARADEPDSADEMSEEIAEEDHPEELIHEDPDSDIPTDDETEFPEPAEEAAIHTISESDIDRDADDESPVGESSVEEWGPADDDSAVEVHYVPSPEDSAPSVVYKDSESTEAGYVTEHIETGEPPAGEDRRDQ